MKSKIVWLILSCLMVAALVLGSCQPAAPEGEGKTVRGKVIERGAPLVEEEEAEEVAPAPGVPQYGGTIPFATGQTGGFDPANVLNFWPSWILIYDALVCEDWARGPSGTGETPLASNYTPTEYFTGWLAESWEILDLQTIIYHLREGVYFHNKPPVNGREMTADDVVYCFNRYKEHANSSWYGNETTITAIDEYTVRFDLPDVNYEILKTGYWNFVIHAPEVAEQYGDVTDWRTVVGTGPFTVVDVVPESSITYEKNPDYWADDPLHPGNRLPYVDGLKALVIIDPATQEAALRTGKIGGLSVRRERAVSLLNTNPELKYRVIPPGNTHIIHMRTDLADMPYADKRVRQALAMAINNQEIADDYYLGDATLHQWPFQPTAGTAFTPLEELPPELKKLYEYHPEEAKALLAEAGYPNGFKVTIQLMPTYAGGVELYSIVKSYWDAIGVETTLDVLETGAYWSVLVGHTYMDMTVSAWGNGNPAAAFSAHACGFIYNYSVVCDDFIESEQEAIVQIVDEEERNQRLKELGLYIIEQQYYINMPTPMVYMMWQPWLKGYSGEVAFGTLNGWYGMYRFVWIDQALKEAMR